MNITLRVARVVASATLIVYVTWVLLILASFAGTAIGNAIR